MNVRFALEQELQDVNALRKQVNDLHVSARGDIFKPGFGATLQDYIYAIWNDPDKRIVVAEQEGRLCGFAILHVVHKPESPYMYGRDYLAIDEFGVDAACRRRGVATAMMAFIRSHAAEAGIHRIELDVWAFNREAQAFYEAVGFKTYRRYMELEP